MTLFATTYYIDLRKFHDLRKFFIVIPENESQSLVVPEHADYIYLNQVDTSEAHYVRRVIEFKGVNSDENFMVKDNTGQDILVQPQPVKHMGFARAWQAVY